MAISAGSEIAVLHGAQTRLLMLDSTGMSPSER